MTLKTSTTWPFTFCTRGGRLRVMSVIPSRFMSKIFTKSYLLNRWLGAVGVEMLATFTRPQSPGKREGARDTLCWARREDPSWCQVTFLSREDFRREAAEWAAGAETPMLLRVGETRP